MNEIILLTAEPRMGKTTCIKKIIEEVGLDNFEGFFTEEIKNDGERTGFACVSLTGERMVFADIHSASEVRLGRYGVKVEDFEVFVIPIIEKAILSNKVLIIDEIGPMQLLSETFKRMVNQVLNADKMIVGTIFYQFHPEVDKIKALPNIQIIQITEGNRDVVPVEIIDKINRKRD